MKYLSGHGILFESMQVTDTHVLAIRWHIYMCMYIIITFVQNKENQ